MQNTVRRFPEGELVNQLPASPCEHGVNWLSELKEDNVVAPG